MTSRITKSHDAVDSLVKQSKRDKIYSSTKKKSAPKEIPFVIKDDFIQLTLPGGRPFTLDSTHETFSRLKKALETSNWKAVPKLVNLAEALVSASAGQVRIYKGMVYYKNDQI